jgi:hypothetical protein
MYHGTEPRNTEILGSQVIRAAGHSGRAVWGVGLGQLVAGIMGLSTT